MDKFEISFHGKPHTSWQSKHSHRIYIGGDGGLWVRTKVWRAGNWDEERPAALSDFVKSDSRIALAMGRAKNLVERGLVPEGIKFHFYEMSPRRLYRFKYDGGENTVYKM